MGGTHPGSQASCRREAKDSALLSSCDGHLLAHTPAACSFPGEKARSWGALGEAHPGQSSLSAGPVAPALAPPSVRSSLSGSA